MDIIWDILKNIFFYGVIATLTFLTVGGLCFFNSDYPENIIYIENGVTIDAIKYENNIYLKKGE